jgi:hypothetical protein
MSYPITWKGAAHFATGRGGVLPRWLVHHRMVGYLSGTDRYFANPDSRPVSTHFGIGRRKAGGPVEISQYVALDDTAYGNGNNVNASGDEVASEWNRLGFPSQPNRHTISIEHEDGGSSTDADGKRGVVDDAVIEASLWLDALLLSGDPAAIRNAGIRYRSTALVEGLFDIPRDATHIIDHHFIAGPLKPYCWQPWLDDKGFPQARYLSALTTSTEEPTLVITRTAFAGGQRVIRFMAGAKAAGYVPRNGVLVEVVPERTWATESSAHASYDAYIDGVLHYQMADGYYGQNGSTYVPASDLIVPDPDPIVLTQRDMDLEYNAALGDATNAVSALRRVVV